ncbi:MAG TPA: hypothetical protein VLJ37_12740 [bacterium]|nr:hypothetical protein [bacterium]
MMKKKFAYALLLFTSIPFAGQFRPSYAKAPEVLSAEERVERLRKGETFTDGGYLKKGVWGQMEGVIQAPPKVVWRLFIQANEWSKYKLPQLVDSRALSEEIAQQSASIKKVDDFYKLLGDRIFDPTQNQRSKTSWINHTFQYYDLPWPVSNKWMVMRNVNDETEGEKGVYRCSWEKMAGNIRTLRGEFRLEPFEGDAKRTLMFYRVETDPGSGVPRFLLKWGVKKSLPAAMRVIRREAVRLANRPSPILKTQ